jgi:hypothetical protein
LIIIDVNKRVFNGPVNGNSSKGKINKFTQNTPTGGIHAVLRIRATVNVDCATYSIHPLQKMVRIKLISGITTHPKRAKRNCDNDGKNRARPKLNSVNITPCTIPKVIRRA